MDKGTPALQITEQKAAPRSEGEALEKLLELQQCILEKLAAHEDPRRVLDELCRKAEALLPHFVATVMVFDATGSTLKVCAAPSLPPEAVTRLDGLRPGPQAGSCGTAVHLGEPVFVEDVRTDLRWAPLLETAEALGLRACWSMPIRIPDVGILGSFALSSFKPRRPSAFDRRLLDVGAHLAGIVLRGQALEQRLLLAATALEHMDEGVMITDAQCRIIQVNASFTRITGYSADEVLGKTPALLRSGRHGEAFYRDFWKALEQDGQWRGEVWNRRKNGEVYPQFLSVKALRDEEGQVAHYVSVFTDASHIKSSEMRLWELAHHDALTGLPNRTYFSDQLEAALAQAAGGSRHLAVLFLDLDRFKNINDSLGHHAGDQLLQQAADRLRACMRAQDVVARLGGDEFVVLMDPGADPDAALRVADKILEAFRQPFDLGGQRFVVTTSIGISYFPRHGADSASLLQHADAAMYEAKKNGRNRAERYAPTMTTSVRNRVALEAELRRALDEEQFVLHYQPFYEAGSGRPAGVEALVRWHHPERGLVSPGEFVPLAEEIGLIHELGYWVTYNACLQGSAWRRAGLTDFVLAVNLSPSQLQGDCAQKLRRLLSETGFPAHQLELEITESLIMEHGSIAEAELGPMCEIGVRLAMDDFGTGFSSMAQLKRLPLTKLKIDRSFVRGVAADPSDAAIVEATVALGHALGLTITAEGVETVAQRGMLEARGCDYLQGYLFAPPVPAAEVPRLLTDMAAPRAAERRTRST
ncbi:MAG TPA: EAL domain-containing protein [Chromatiales bacterium]|nr:EAL domain-containing protein [Chromatiales bacterium]